MVSTLPLANAVEEDGSHYPSTDADTQVVLMDRDDHGTMLKLYFALKVWVMEEGFSIE